MGGFIFGDARRRARGGEWRKREIRKMKIKQAAAWSGPCRREACGRVCGGVQSGDQRVTLPKKNTAGIWSDRHMWRSGCRYSSEQVKQHERRLCTSSEKHACESAPSPAEIQRAVLTHSLLHVVPQFSLNEVFTVFWQRKSQAAKEQSQSCRLKNNLVAFLQVNTNMT